MILVALRVELYCCTDAQVQYAFWQAAGDLPEHFHVEMANDAWEEAAKELLRKLVDAGVQQGQAGRKRELVALVLNLVGIAVLPLQVLSIDAHNKGWNSAAVLLAVARPGWEDAGCSYSFQVLSPTLNNRGSLMACKTAGCLITVVQEVVRRSRPGRGPLELSCQVRRDGGWELLYRWADQAHSPALTNPPQLAA